jgi:hypothetical protein
VTLSIQPVLNPGERSRAVRRWLLTQVERILGLYVPPRVQWLTTDRRPPNHLEFGFGADVGAFTYFGGGVLEHDRDRLHARLDDLIKMACAELAKHPRANVWRLGELRLRVRIGTAETPIDYALIGRYPNAQLANVRAK